MLTVYDLAERQHGVVTREQLYALGVSPRTLSRRVKAGVWQAHGKSVLTLRGTPDDLATRSRVVARRVPGAVLTGPSAAVLLGKGPWDTVDLGSQPWVVARSVRGVPARFVTHAGAAVRTVEGLDVADPPTAVVDLLRFLPLAQARTLAYRALQTRVLTVVDLQAAHDRLLGRAGAPQLRALTVDVSTGAHADSERRLVELVTRAGLTGWVPNLPVTLPGGWLVHVDLGFEDAKLAVEVDGRAWHTDPKRFQADRTRQNALTRAGWTVAQVHVGRPHPPADARGPQHPRVPRPALRRLILLSIPPYPAGYRPPVASSAARVAGIAAQSRG